ncbi:hypothetical protein BCR39DRAFT_575404 [Naematelia encephala]|uniref:Uncharacterized protein n=1 Tax=Naematelia encephala TaxID=71784 RepID=A0A1Y2B2F2_9TREE|nr:hypothetical protein BCR39DRAFT_575404 [Naematelia encephala]
MDSPRYNRWSTPDSDSDITEHPSTRETDGFSPTHLPTPISTPQPHTPDRSIIVTSSDGFGLKSVHSGDKGGPQKKKRDSEGGGEDGRYPDKLAVVERLRTDVGDLAWDLTGVVVDPETMSTYDWRIRSRRWIFSLEASLPSSLQEELRKVTTYLKPREQDKIAPIAPGTPLGILERELSAYIGLLDDITTPLARLGVYDLFERYEAEDSLQEILRFTLGVRQSWTDIQLEVGMDELGKDREEVVRKLECQWSLFQSEFMKVVKDRLIKAERLDKRCPSMMSRMARENKILKKQVDGAMEGHQAHIEDAMLGLSMARTD